MLQEALFYEKQNNQNVKCTLCPWFCELKPGMIGVCKVRRNENGKLVTDVYNRVAALGTDPIEKKPLYHFHPGKNILSIGEVGCNLKCTFCQNHRISQCYASEFRGFYDITSEQIVKEAKKTWKNIGIAYTYNEPFTFYEFMLETAKLAKSEGLKNVVVSNGYINPEPLKQALPWLDAFNIDLKGFSENFYKKQTKGKLAPVLETLKIIAKSNAHLEITTLIIPELNDNEKEFSKMVDWIAAELGVDVPLHLSRFFPQHKLESPPTPLKKLQQLFEVANKKLQFTYLGNVSDEKRSATHCPGCGEILVRRNHYSTQFLQDGFIKSCTNCGKAINMVI
ncbi:MAG TPA: AmmeMemoRadiSam system radical SAM enzyme [Prolixibacteraceae bacterium]|nr:AmmeMemoRadiSam system radical SAM enzyme [Prolixibacteraceae bacterium]